MIYFIQAGDGGPIKIGYVLLEDRECVDDRLRSLQTANPAELRVLATKLGGLGEERRLHAVFAEGRIRGEWFDADTPGLADEIELAKLDEGVVAWQLRADGQQICEWCECAVVHPPRRTLCSTECSEERKAFRRIGVDIPPVQPAKMPSLQGVSNV